MIRYTQILSALGLTIIVISISACEGNFAGLNGAVSGRKMFSGGDNNPPGSGNQNPNGTNTNTNNGLNPDGTPIGTNDGNHVNPGGLLEDGSLDTRLYKPATVKILRRDHGAGNGQSGSCDGSVHDQCGVSLVYNVKGSRKTPSGNIGGEGSSFTIPEACPDNATVIVDIYFDSPEGKITPNKQNKGGPIGFRRAENILWVGVERDAVNSDSDRAYHNNDDLVLEIRCDNSKRIEIPNLCLDQSIPDGSGTRNGVSYTGKGSDLVTDEVTNSSDNGRSCTGT